jgi:hypothetical protein
MGTSWIEVQINKAQIQQMQQVISQQEKFRIAAERAINRGVEAARTEASREIRKRYDITDANIRADRNIKLKKAIASGDEIVGEISFAGRKIPLYRFHPNPKSRQYTREFVNGVSGWRKTSAVKAADVKGKMQARDNAFIATFQSGHTGIFRRTKGTTSSGKAKLREYWGFAVADMLDYQEAREAILQKATETVQKRLDHEITAALNGGYGK